MQFEPLYISVDDTGFPLRHAFSLRDGIVTLESQFLDGYPDDVAEDVRQLKAIPFTTCASGASDFPVLPILIELRSEDKFQTGRDVLKAIEVRHFESDHVDTLDQMWSDFAGYHPLTRNDEIHNNASEQFIFDDDLSGESATAHRKLRNMCVDGKMWYVLIHMPPKPPGGLAARGNVLLFALGRSPSSGHIIGAVTQQICHNLCD